MSATSCSMCSRFAMKRLLERCAIFPEEDFLQFGSFNGEGRGEVLGVVGLLPIPCIAKVDDFLRELRERVVGHRNRYFLIANGE